MISLRPLFMVVFTAYLTGITVYAIYCLIAGLFPVISGIGLTLAGLAPVAYLAWIRLARPEHTEKYPVGISVLTGLGLAMTMVASWRYGDTAGLLHGYAGASLICWFAYLRWYCVDKN